MRNIGASALVAVTAIVLMQAAVEGKEFSNKEAKEFLSRAKNATLTEFAKNSAKILNSAVEIVNDVARTKCPSVWGINICVPFTRAAARYAARRLRETGSIWGDYYACWKPCEAAGGPKGAPDSPLTCKGACSALTGSRTDPYVQIQTMVEACRQRDALPPQVLAIYNQMDAWCKEEK